MEEYLVKIINRLTDIKISLLVIIILLIVLTTISIHAKGQSIPTISTDSIILIGSECQASTTPHCGGFLAYALPLTKSSDNPFYSWTKIYQAAPTGLNLKSSLPASITTTGFAKDFYNHTFTKSGSSIAFIGIGAIGVSNSASAVTGAFNDGFGVVGKGVGSKTKLTWLRWWIGGMHVKTSGIDKIDVMVSLGK